VCFLSNRKWVDSFLVPLSKLRGFHQLRHQSVMNLANFIKKERKKTIGGSVEVVEAVRRHRDGTKGMRTMTVVFKKLTVKKESERDIAGGPTGCPALLEKGSGSAINGGDTIKPGREKKGNPKQDLRVQRQISHCVDPLFEGGEKEAMKRSAKEKAGKPNEHV